jgi:hypothetical protein
MSEFNRLSEMVQSLEVDFKKFYEQDNKAAGTRLRKGLMDIRNKVQDIRKDVQERKNK